MKRKNSADRPPFQKEQLQQLLTWLIPVLFIFAVIETAASIVFRDVAAGVAGAILLGYEALLLLALIQVRRDRGQAAITIMCVGLLAATLGAVLVEPSWFPVLIVTPLLAIMVALPYVSRRSLLLLVIAGWLVTTAVATIGRMFSSSSQVPLWFEKVPLWFENIFLVGSITVAVATVLLLLWQFRSRLTRMLAQTQTAEERYALAAQATNDGLWDWDLRENQIYLSSRWKSMLGYEEHEIGTSPKEWLGRIHPDDRAHTEARLSALLNRSTDTFESEYRIVHKQGHYLWVLARGVAVRNDSGKATRITGAQADITERKRAEQQLLHNALHDPLTGLPNRALFMERLREAVEHPSSYNGRPFAVLFLDLDRFKNINDGLGHTVGDALLIEVAYRLMSGMRSGTTVARLGGDEFAILLREIEDVNEAIRVAIRIQEKLSEPLNLHGYELSTTASIGITVSDGSKKQQEDLLRDADTAMYRAKALGRGRHEIFDREMHSSVVTLLQLETDLRQAIEREEFKFYYQPIVSLRTGRITGFEALLRWQHPQRGLIYPEEFIPILEDTGLIVPVGWMMLKRACRQIRAWQERFSSRTPFTVSVNLSGTQVAQPDFLQEVKWILHRTGLDPYSLRFEITESTIMRDVHSAMLSRVRELNVQLHVDDFGTGYSSLGTLHRFPIDALKIDRTFVERLGDDGENAELVQTIVTMAHNLGMDVIAEGVQTETQIDSLRTLGCDYGQGYLFSEPLQSRNVEQLVTKNPQW